MSSLTIKTFSAWPKMSDPLDEEALLAEEQDFCQKKAMVTTFLFFLNFQKILSPQRKKKVLGLEVKDLLVDDLEEDDPADYESGLDEEAEDMSSADN